MEIRVKITDILQRQQGISKAGKKWTKDIFLGETFEEYPQTIAFESFNEKVRVPEIGSDVIVQFDIRSSTFETNGTRRASTVLNAWRIDQPQDGVRTAPVAQPTYQQPQQPQQPYYAAQPQVPQDPAYQQQPVAPAPTDDMPF